jgi:type I restriction enzyme S subunit
MEEWKEYKISDVIDEISMGPFGSNIKVDNFIDFGVPVLNGSNLQGFKLQEESFNYVSQEKADSLGKANAHKGDVVITHRGTLGQIVYIPQDSKFEQYVISQSQDLIRPDFFVYFFHTPIGQHRILMNASQVGVPALARPTTTFKDVFVPVPPLETQNAIMAILSSLDKKIEVNKRLNDNFALSFLLLTCFVLWLLKLRNDNLLKQARALYKSWFVDFEPFKNGEFEDSELGMIPHGWSVKQLGEITKQLNEKVKERVDVKVLSPITTGELVLSEEYFTKQVFSESISKYIVVKPTDFAYNPARVNIGSLGMNEYDFDGCVSPVYVVFRCEDGYQYFFDLFRRTEAFKEEVRTRAIGGVRQSLAYKDFSLIKVVYPPIDVIHSFNQVYSRILAKTKHNNVETTRLASIRDTLLPKLISGELKIS